jgi:hypothetical protein
VTSDPKRLTVVGATDLERTLLQAARGERPSPELTARMAAGLGLSAAAAVTAAPAAAAAAAPVAAAKGSLAVWVSAGVLAAAVGAGVVGVRMSAPPAPAVHADKPAAAVTARAEVPAVAASVPAERRIERARKRPAPAAHAPVPASDLRDQIALIDAARTAVKAGSTERALALLQRYDATFPGGAFRPEAQALRIEALDEAGRATEARSLARDFLARHPDSPLAGRVAKIVRK